MATEACGLMRRGTHLWTEPELETLKTHAGVLMPYEIARLISEMGICPRSDYAIRAKARELGIDTFLIDPFWSATAVRRLFRISDHWSFAFVLPAVFIPGGEPGVRSFGEWRVKESAIETFLREQPWAYAPRAMFPRFHRLARLGAAMHARDPWWAADECAAHLGVSSETIRRRMNDGSLPFKQRHFGMRGGVSVQTGVRVVRSSDLIGVVWDRRVAA